MIFSSVSHAQDTLLWISSTLSCCNWWPSDVFSLDFSAER